MQILSFGEDTVIYFSFFMKEIVVKLSFYLGV